MHSPSPALPRCNHRKGRPTCSGTSRSSGTTRRQKSLPITAGAAAIFFSRRTIAHRNAPGRSTHPGGRTPGSDNSRFDPHMAIISRSRPGRHSKILSERPRTASRLMGLSLLGWPRPRSQHDVAELIDFLQPRIVRPTPPGCWVTRQHTDTGIETTAPVSTLRCVQLLVDASNPTPDIQTLIHRWHTQPAMHALAAAPLWLFLQIPRFLYRSAGRPVKQTQAYILPQSVQLPVFVDSVSLAVHWQQYRVSACIQHHGPLPSQGHYTTVAFLTHAQWMLDDEKEPTPLTDEQLDHLSANVYLMLLTCSIAASAAPSDTSAQPHTASAAHGSPSGASHLARRGPRLDIQPHLPDPLPAYSPVGTTGSDATGSEPHAGGHTHPRSSIAARRAQVHRADHTLHHARDDG